MKEGGQERILVENWYDHYHPLGPWYWCEGSPNWLQEREELTEHNSTDFNEFFQYRGNVTLAVSGGVNRCYQYDITGTVVHVGGMCRSGTFR